MFVKVSPKQGMWGYNHLWFTFADPQPHEIDLESLDSQTAEKVQMALDVGTLLEVGADGQRVEKEQAVYPVEKPIVPVTPIVTESVDSSEIAPGLRNRAKDMLNNGVATLRREIMLQRNRPLLASAMEEERKGKNRKTVVDLLEKQINKINAVRPSADMYHSLVTDEEDGELVFKMEDLMTSVDRQLEE